MATHTALERVNRGVLQVASAPLRILRYATTEPLITGAALLVLTRAPARYRDRLLSALREGGLSTDRIAKLVNVLKLLLGIGVLRRLNQALTALALNMWHLQRPGAPFQFGTAGKPEIVVVTGGCSGFGYEMVKGFSKYARVIILDISPIPPELAKSKPLKRTWTSHQADQTLQFRTCITTSWICRTSRQLNPLPNKFARNTAIQAY